MLIGLDHIIIGVHDLTQATHIFTERLGFAVSGGGTHPTGGTANRIIVIGDTYLELITVRNATEAQHSMLQRLAKGDGYLNCVLASNDIQADSRAMAQRGIKILGPSAGKLTAADGRSRSWSRTDVERAELTQRYPFLIQHDSTGQERRTRLAGWTLPPPHPLGVTKVLSATIAVADLGEATQRFQHIYGLQASDQYTGEADGWDAILVSFWLREQMQSLELATPLPALLDPIEGQPMFPDAGALAYHLQQFGESLCRITLAVENLDVSKRFLDERNVSYAYRAMPRPSLWILPDQACGATLVLHEFTPDLPEDFPLEG
jgi:catechol 2,3-dioxygenase-like lactoylglutathione lyase family enzyme